MLNELLHLVYPEICLNCDNELGVRDKHLCSICTSELHYTNFQYFNEASPMDKLFWGRTPVIFTYAHLSFQKEGSSQKVLFNLKYRHKKSLGNFFGKEIGQQIKGRLPHSKSCVIVPVPLHHKRKFTRGYNQSEALASGIEEIIDLPIRTDLARRVRHTDTQTKKSRFERWDNLTGVFSVSDDIRLYEQVVLVDDVITTGATLEQLMLAIKNVHPEVRFCVVTLAIA